MGLEGHSLCFSLHILCSSLHFFVFLRFCPLSGFLKRGLANGVSPLFFSENETEENGKKRKNRNPTKAAKKEKMETEENGRKRMNE